MPPEEEKRFTPIIVVMDASRSLAPGNLTTQLSADKQNLFVPAELATRVGLPAGFRTVDALLSYLHSFPSSFAKGLGWTIDEVRAATALLVASLEGLVPERYLRPGPPKAYAMGALPPPHHPVQEGFTVGDDDKDYDHGNGD